MHAGGHGARTTRFTHAFLKCFISVQSTPREFRICANFCSFSVADVHSIEPREGDLPFQRHAGSVHPQPLQPSAEDSDQNFSALISFQSLLKAQRDVDTGVYWTKRLISKT